MKQSIQNSTLSLALLLTSGGALADTVYVQPIKAALKKEPQMTAITIAEPTRGTALEVQKKEGPWLQVSTAGKTGWVNKLFVAATQPVGQSDLQKLSEDQNLAKSARRRSSSYTVAATTRGLTAGNRVREGREAYPSDFDAVQKIDTYQVDANELSAFKKAGNLGE